MTDREKVMAWLAHIGETDPDCIQEVIEQCKADMDARRFYVSCYDRDCSESVIERAAICEYMGGMSRAEAERFAWNEFANKEAKK